MVNKTNVGHIKKGKMLDNGETRQTKKQDKNVGHGKQEKDVDNGQTSVDCGKAKNLSQVPNGDTHKGLGLVKGTSMHARTNNQWLIVRVVYCPPLRGIP